MGNDDLQQIGYKCTQKSQWDLLHLRIVNPENIDLNLR
jgi:hypothetical protein